MTTGQALTAVKRKKATMMSITVMLLTLGEKMTQSDVILAFINSDEEEANDRPNATRSG